MYYIYTMLMLFKNQQVKLIHWGYVVETYTNYHRKEE